MKTRLFLKLFLGMGVPFGIVAVILMGPTGIWLGSSAPFGWAVGGALGVASGLAAGALFGGPMALILGAIHFSQTDDPNVRHQRMLRIDASLDRSTQLCVEAMEALPGVRGVGGQAGRLTAKRRTSWRTWGDRISCHISQGSPGEQKIVLCSRPSLPTTIVDYGSNLRNVQALESYLLEMGAQPEPNS